MAFQPFIDIPVLQIRPTGLLVYEKREWLINRSYRPKKKTPTEPDNNETPTKAFENTPAGYSGDMTVGSIKRMKRAIQLLIAMSLPKTVQHPKTGKYFTFRINFITLTLPAAQDEIGDKEIRSKCLEPWIRVMRTKHQMKSYIWKAERQLNGNIHYHVTTDTFIHYYRIMDVWNNQLAKLGFIERFKAKHGHNRPNSTDVHSVQQINNLPGYLIKYMAKGALSKFLYKPKKVTPIQTPHIFHSPAKAVEILKMAMALKKIDGKMWDCSQNLKGVKWFETIMDIDEDRMFEQMATTFPGHYKRDTNYSAIWLNEKEMLSNLPPKYLTEYQQWLNHYRRK